MEKIAIQLENTDSLKHLKKANKTQAFLFFSPKQPNNYSNVQTLAIEAGAAPKPGTVVSRFGTGFFFLGRCFSFEDLGAARTLAILSSSVAMWDKKVSRGQLRLFAPDPRIKSKHRGNRNCKK